MLKICRIILLPLLVLPPARPGPRPGPPGFQEQLVAPHPVEVAHGDAGEFDRGLGLQHGGRHHGVLKDLADDDAKGLRRQGQAGDEQGQPEHLTYAQKSRALWGIFFTKKIMHTFNYCFVANAKLCIVFCSHLHKKFLC